MSQSMVYLFERHDPRKGKVDFTQLAADWKQLMEQEQNRDKSHDYDIYCSWDYFLYFDKCVKQMANEIPAGANEDFKFTKSAMSQAEEYEKIVKASYFINNLQNNNIYLIGKLFSILGHRAAIASQMLRSSNTITEENYKILKETMEYDNEIIKQILVL